MSISTAPSVGWLFALSVLVICFVSGCQTSQDRAFEERYGPQSRETYGQKRPPGGIKLQQCIKLMESGAIHTGMDTNAVRRIFGQWVSFYDDQRAVAYIYDPRTDRIPVGHMLAPGWRVNFTVSKSGIVTWYVLTNASNK